MDNDTRPFTVLVEGNIGCGKTTFINFFASHADIFTEPIKLWQNVGGFNLLNLQYEDPSRWAGLFQSYVMLNALKIHLTPNAKPVKIIERSLFSSHYCFAENLYHIGKLHEAEYQVLSDWFNFLTTHPEVSVDLIVYLKIKPEKALERIQSRARSEENNISLTYLQELHTCHENWLMQHKFPLPAPVLVIDANQELAELEIEYLKYQDVILGKKKIS